MKKSLHSRFVDNWISSLVGLAVIFIGLLMFYQQKIDWEVTTAVVSFGLGIALVKYKKNENEPAGN